LVLEVLEVQQLVVLLRAVKVIFQRQEQLQEMAAAPAV
jgi:hypothetical protein